MVAIENAFGISSVVGAVGILIGVKGAKPHSVLTLVVGVFLIVIAAGAAAVFSNFDVMAKTLNLKSIVNTPDLDASLRVSSLWTLIYPALVGALGVNLLTSWFQSSKPYSTKEPIETTVAKLLEEQTRRLESKVGRVEQAPLQSSRQPSKKKRATLVRRR